MKNFLIFLFKYLNKYTVLFPCLIFFSCTKFKITVPVGYIGEVCLIKSNVKDNQLNIDSNGIGYINESTFEDLTFQPIVVDASGKDLTSNCVGYNPSEFWAIGKAKSSEIKIVIESLSFEIVPDNLKGIKQYYDTDLFKLVDTLKLK